MMLDICFSTEVMLDHTLITSICEITTVESLLQMAGVLDESSSERVWRTALLKSWLTLTLSLWSPMFLKSVKT